MRRKTKSIDPFYRGKKHTNKKVQLNDPPGFNPLREKQKTKRERLEKIRQLKRQHVLDEEDAEKNRFAGLSRAERKQAMISTKKKAKKRLVTVSTDIGEHRSTLIGGPEAQFSSLFVAAGAADNKSGKRKRGADGNTHRER